MLGVSVWRGVLEVELWKEKGAGVGAGVAVVDGTCPDILGKMWKGMLTG